MSFSLPTKLASPALSDLGLGDQVKQQLEDMINNKKKNVNAAGLNMGQTIGNSQSSLAAGGAVNDVFGMIR